MAMLVDFQELWDEKSLTLAAAFARSSWEDLQQQRRGLLAGKAAPKLGPRKDQDAPRLLTPDEEEKVQKSRQQQSFAGSRGRTFYRPNFRGDRSRSNKPRDRSFSRSSGKGKGKGKKKESDRGKDM